MRAWVTKLSFVYSNKLKRNGIKNIKLQNITNVNITLIINYNIVISGNIDDVIDDVIMKFLNDNGYLKEVCSIISRSPEKKLFLI